MSHPILDLSFGKLKDPVKQLDQEVYDLAAYQLELTSISPVLYLYSISRLGPSNASSRWLKEHGLNESVIFRYIQQNLPKRPVRRRGAFRWISDQIRPVLGLEPKREVYQLSRAESLPAMLAALQSLDGCMNGKNLFVYHLVLAAVDSNDTHVVALFDSVGMSMDEVRAALGFADAR